MKELIKAALESCRLVKGALRRCEELLENLPEGAGDELALAARLSIHQTQVASYTAQGHLQLAFAEEMAMDLDRREVKAERDLLDFVNEQLGGCAAELHELDLWTAMNLEGAKSRQAIEIRVPSAQVTALVEKVAEIEARLLKAKGRSNGRR
jgi:hypothetical protein